MAKKRPLCKLKDDKVAKDLKRLMKVVREPEYICRRCARAASDDAYLCKAVKID